MSQRPAPSRFAVYRVTYGSGRRPEGVDGDMATLPVPIAGPPRTSPYPDAILRPGLIGVSGERG
jgi:hypothetical protein